MKLSIEIEGLDDLREKVAKAPGEAQDILESQTFDAFDRLSKLFAQYPDRPGSTYKRTFKLQDEWGIGAASMNYRTTSLGFGFVGQIVNATSYASYVQGNEEGHQAWMHVGIWQPITGILGAQEENIRERYEIAMQRIADKFED